MNEVKFGTRRPRREEKGRREEGRRRSGRRAGRGGRGRTGREPSHDESGWVSLKFLQVTLLGAGAVALSKEGAEREGTEDEREYVGVERDEASPKKSS
eukprot:8321017-Pyramimonas_sp.AAC.1